MAREPVSSGRWPPSSGWPKRDADGGQRPPTAPPPDRRILAHSDIIPHPSFAFWRLLMKHHLLIGLGMALALALAGPSLVGQAGQAPLATPVAGGLFDSLHFRSVSYTHL